MLKPEEKWTVANRVFDSFDDADAYATARRDDELAKALFRTVADLVGHGRPVDVHDVQDVVIRLREDFEIALRAVKP